MYELPTDLGQVAQRSVKWTGSATTVKSYYYVGGTRVAMRTGASTLNYLLSDHLGSTSVSYNTSTSAVSAQRYTPYVAPRGPASMLPTDYKFAGLRADTGQWVIGAVQNGVETLLAAATASPPAVNTWYQLDVVVARVGGQDRVTLYANNTERVAWASSAGHPLTGGRVEVMARSGAAQFEELEQWDVGRVTKTYSSGGQRVALRRDGALYFVYTDHLGSSSLLTTEQGTEVPGTRLKYYAYGAPRPRSDAATHNVFALDYTPATYTGQTRDASTGLLYYGARWYDSYLNRWSQSPLNTRGSWQQPLLVSHLRHRHARPPRCASAARPPPAGSHTFRSPALPASLESRRHDENRYTSPYRYLVLSSMILISAGVRSNSV